MEKSPKFNLNPEQEIVEIFGNKAQGYYYEIFRRFDNNIKKEIVKQIKAAQEQKVSVGDLLKGFNRIVEEVKKTGGVPAVAGNKDYVQVKNPDKDAAEFVKQGAEAHTKQIEEYELDSARDAKAKYLKRIN